MKKINTGEVYTPINIVDKMLDFVHYNSDSILKKHIIDNSCGKGAFLLRVVERYIDIAKNKKYSDEEITDQLETYIHGIEINENSYLETLKNLDLLVIEKGLTNKVNWNILNSNSLDVSEFNNKMDYVVGNPPYIRIHELNFDYKKYEFSKKGMTDLYIIFFEIGIKMLGDNGKLVYITPNSYLNSSTSSAMRKYLIQNNLIESVLDLKLNNPFKSILVYPIITVLNKKKENSNICVKSSNNSSFIIKNNDFYIDDKFIFENEDNRTFFKKVVYEKNANIDVFVKNGLSTNADNLYFNMKFKGGYIIDAIKASKLLKTKLFFPYNINGDLVPLEQIRLNNRELYNYLIDHKDELCKRSIKNLNDWYGFGRTQAIKDVFKDRITINNIIKDINSVKISKIDAGVGVYGGFYIYSDSIDYKDIIKIILNDNFIKYLKCLNKLKSGGYYTFSTLDLKKYINYMFKDRVQVAV